MRGLPELVPSIASVSVRIELSFIDYCFHFSICELLWNHSSAVWKCYKTITNLLAVTGSKIRPNRVGCVVTEN